MCAFIGKADGWRYEQGGAILDSFHNYVTGDWDKPTRLGILAIEDYGGKEAVMMVLVGECDITDFRDNQMYVVVSFDGNKAQRWRIKMDKYNEREFNAFTIVNATAFLKHLQEAESISVTLPLYKQGTQTFRFYAGGYPLDW